MSGQSSHNTAYHLDERKLNQHCGANQQAVVIAQPCTKSYTYSSRKARRIAPCFLRTRENSTARKISVRGSSFFASKFK